MTKEELLKLIEDFVVNEPSKAWRPGKDHVHYAGPYFNQKEIVRSVSTLISCTCGIYPPINILITTFN